MTKHMPDVCLSVLISLSRDYHCFHLYLTNRFFSALYTSLIPESEFLE